MNNPLYVILVVILVVFLIGALPVWPHAVGWGYYPSGAFGLVLLVLIIMLLLGKL